LFFVHAAAGEIAIERERRWQGSLCVLCGLASLREAFLKHISQRRKVAKQNTKKSTSAFCLGGRRPNASPFHFTPSFAARIAWRPM
jgi:hypothetical protein